MSSRPEIERLRGELASLEGVRRAARAERVLALGWRGLLYRLLSQLSRRPAPRPGAWHFFARVEARLGWGPRLLALLGGPVVVEVETDSPAEGFEAQSSAWVEAPAWSRPEVRFRG